MASQDLLFARGDLSAFLEQRLQDALDAVGRVGANEVLARPHEQIAEEIIERYLVLEPHLDKAGMTGGVTDERIDVSQDMMRVVSDRSKPFYIAGSRITLRVPLTGRPELLQDARQHVFARSTAGEHR